MVEQLKSQRYVISVILSFLEEHEGVRFLITNKRWFHSILPIFLLPMNRLHLVSDETSGRQRYFFKVIPIQDPHTLRDRLNTRRLTKRMSKMNHEEKISMYRFMSTLDTDQIAWKEWKTSQTYTTTSQTNDSNWSAKFELLRFRTEPNDSLSFDSLEHSRPPKILPGITLIASYPRSGNTLLRSLIERVTNLVTGSDTRPDRTLSRSLAVEHGLVGEGLTQSHLTPVVKTHYPERSGYRKFSASRIILLVRNPYDAIDSYWNMCCTNTHTESITEDIYDLYSEKFVQLAKNEIRTWLRFAKYWMEDGEKSKDDNISKTSLLVVRYEDLVLNTIDQMERVLKFMIYGHTEKELHPFWNWRLQKGLDVTKGIPDKTESSHKKSQINGTLGLGSYTPRIQHHNNQDENNQYNTIQCQNLSDKRLVRIGKSLKRKRYSKEIIDHFHQVASLEDYKLRSSNEELLNVLEHFGYSISKQQFPFNFLQEEKSVEDLQSKFNTISKATVNDGFEIRSQNDPFGREMTRWRRGETCNDLNPFPIVKKNNKM